MQIDSQGLDSIRIFATSLSLALKHAMQIPVHAGKAKNMTRYTSFQIIASQQWQYHTALAMNFTCSSKFQLPFRAVSVNLPPAISQKLCCTNQYHTVNPLICPHYSRGWISVDVTTTTKNNQQNHKHNPPTNTKATPNTNQTRHKQQSGIVQQHFPVLCETYV